MARPCKCRCIRVDPAATVYKPQGIPTRFLELVELGWDELEAIRLADRLGLYHEEAARRMQVSRATFGRILTRARGKVAAALLEGKGLVFRGGTVRHAKVQHEPGKEMEKR
jgi:hypothetical protein